MLKRNGFTLIELPAMRKGFTLIELLVVVTIIVVLLALLVPSLDKAIYQAELAVCAANQKLIAFSAIQYAHANKRYYPVRPGITSSTAPFASLMPNSLQNPSVVGYDLRPVFKDQMGLSVNKTAMCALVSPIDLDTAPLPDEYVHANQAFWFGWKYADADGYSHRGMNKLGDRWDWTVIRSSLLVSDYELISNSTGPQASHPDRDKGMMYNFQAVRAGIFGPALPQTITYWQGTPGLSRGDVDNNYAYDDGSVRRANGVGVFEPNEWDRVPDTVGNNRPGVGFQIPKEGR